MVLESVLVSFFYKWLTSFHSTTFKGFVFSPLYSIAFFVKNKVGAWIYLCTFNSVPLTYISVFVPVPYCLDDCGFVVEPKVTQVDLRKAFLSLLAILWNSAFRWEYLSFSPLLFTSLLFTAICKASQTAILLFCTSFSWVGSDHMDHSFV